MCPSGRIGRSGWGWQYFKGALETVLENQDGGRTICELSTSTDLFSGSLTCTQKTLRRNKSGTRNGVLAIFIWIIIVVIPRAEFKVASFGKFLGIWSQRSGKEKFEKGRELNMNESALWSSHLLPWKLISAVWLSVVILEGLQVPPGGWQPNSYSV